MKSKVLFILLFHLSLTAHAEEQGTSCPPDVLKFIERREMCDHFRGEMPGDRSERAEDVNHELSRYCTGTDRELAALREKYAHQAETVKRLSAFDDCVEGTCEKWRDKTASQADR